jgi:hypothetical protein
MKTKEIFEFVGKVGYFYHQKSDDSIAINLTIAQFLGTDDLYIKFCQEVASNKRKNPFIPESESKTFSPDFIENPEDVKNEISDMDVYVNFTFPSLMESLGKVIDP